MRVGWVIFLVLLCPSTRAGMAAADTLVMPYRCSVNDGSVRLAPAPAQSYVISGPRQERAFQDCGRDFRGNPACITVVAHRFYMSCGSSIVSWARVAEAARGLGLAFPRAMPPDFAPMSQLQARLVLPALARFTPHEDRVSVEALSDDAIRDGAADKGTLAGWTAAVKAEMRPEGFGAAWRIGGIISVLLAAFLTFAHFASRVMALEPLTPRASGIGRQWNRLQETSRRAMVSWGFGADAKSASQAYAGVRNGIALAQARYAETEHLVASLDDALVLRDVLMGELRGVRTRIESVSAGLSRRPAEKSSIIIRSLLRDLDRISRIASGAGRDAKRDAHTPPAFSMPETLQDAYRILGLNGDAAPAVAKKLVDALRMTWHPDFARDEEDMLTREARMKQINAAWDMIKTRTVQAA